MLRPTNSHIGMSLYSVAETKQFLLGGMGGGFLEAPMIFLSLAPFLSFSKKERNGERKTSSAMALHILGFGIMPVSPHRAHTS